MKTELLQSPWEAAEWFWFCWALTVTPDNCPLSGKKLSTSMILSSWRDCTKASWKVFAPVRFLTYKCKFLVMALKFLGTSRWVQNSPHCFPSSWPRSVPKVEWLESLWNITYGSHKRSNIIISVTSLPSKGGTFSAQTFLYCLAFGTKGGGNSSKCHPKHQQSVRGAAWDFWHVRCRCSQC